MAGLPLYRTWSGGYRPEHAKRGRRGIEGGGLTADEERMIILGNEILAFLEEHPGREFSQQVLAFLDVVLTEDSQRALFNLSPRMRYDGKMLPFKLPRDDF